MIQSIHDVEMVLVGHEWEFGLKVSPTTPASRHGGHWDAYERLPVALKQPSSHWIVKPEHTGRELNFNGPQPLGSAPRRFEELHGWIEELRGRGVLIGTDHDSPPCGNHLHINCNPEVGPAVSGAHLYDVYVERYQEQFWALCDVSPTKLRARMEYNGPRHPDSRFSDIACQHPLLEVIDIDLDRCRDVLICATCFRVVGGDGRCSGRCSRFANDGLYETVFHRYTGKEPRKAIYTVGEVLAAVTNPEGTAYVLRQRIRYHWGWSHTRITQARPDLTDKPTLGRVRPGFRSFELGKGGDLSVRWKTTPYGRENHDDRGTTELRMWNSSMDPAVNAERHQLVIALLKDTVKAAKRKYVIPDFKATDSFYSSLPRVATRPTPPRDERGRFMSATATVTNS